MTRDAFLSARVVFALLVGSLGLAFVLVLIGAPDGASFLDVVRGAVLSTGAAYGAHASTSAGKAQVLAAASPLLISLLPLAGAWWLVRRSAIRLDWVGAAAVSGGLAMFGLAEWANGLHGVAVNAPVAGVGLALALAVIGTLGWAADRWGFVRRPVDLLICAALGLVLVGLATELVTWLSYSGGGGGGVAWHTELTLAIAYAPNVGVAAVALGLGGGLAVTGISPEYFTFVARFAGEGPTANFGAPHGQGDWAQALHLPGLVCVYVLAPLLVIALAYVTSRLRSRGERVVWASGLTILFVGASVAASMRLSVNYEGFELAGSLAPTWWGRLAALMALPLGLALAQVRSATEPGLDVGDRTRELSREVS